MFKAIGAALIFCLATFPAAMTHAQGNAMPLTQEYMVATSILIKQGIESITQEDQVKMQGNTGYSKVIITRMVVEPITSKGYDFNDTIYGIGNFISQRGLPQQEPLASAMLFVVQNVFAASNYLSAYQMITPETKAVLETAVARILRDNK